MAITTKRFSAPITTEFGLAVSTSFSFSESLSGSSIVGSTQARSYPSSKILNESSTLISTIYTVPAGRTAKVYINRSILFETDFSESLYISGNYSSGSYMFITQTQPSIYYYIGLRVNSYFDYPYVSNGQFQHFDAGTYSGTFYPLFSSYFSTSSSIVESANRSISRSGVSFDLSDSTKGTDQFFFMGPGQSLNLFVSTHYSLFSYQTIIQPNVNSIGVFMTGSVSYYLSISARVISYLDFTVIEELGS